MPKIQWDTVGDRTYEGGLDRGVLYLSNGSGVPWNGLTDVTEKNEKKVSPIYFDGIKTHDKVELGDFAGSMSAITYPEELLEYEGYGRLVRGVFVGDQEPMPFGLSYRTRVGNDVDGNAGYKIHAIYNVTAIPSDKQYSTLTDSPEFTEFEWDITAVPEEVAGFRPTAHIVLDSRHVDETLLNDVELLLYGGETADAILPPFEDLMELILGFFLVEIVDNNDGTWTAYTDFDGYITELADGEFRMDNVNAEYLDADTYELSDTR